MTRHHVLDVYGTHLHLATTKAEWKQIVTEFPVLKQWTPKAETAGQVSCFARQPKGRLAQLIIVIWIDARRHTNPRELIDTCAHEASHAAGRILEHAGHEVAGTDEPHAYLCGWLTGWLYEGTSAQAR